MTLPRRVVDGSLVDGDVVRIVGVELSDGTVTVGCEPAGLVRLFRNLS